MPSWGVFWCCIGQVCFTSRFRNAWEILLQCFNCNLEKEKNVLGQTGVFFMLYHKTLFTLPWGCLKILKANRKSHILECKYFFCQRFYFSFVWLSLMFQVLTVASRLIDVWKCRSVHSLQSMALECAYDCLSQRSLAFKTTPIRFQSTYLSQAEGIRKKKK